MTKILKLTKRKIMRNLCQEHSEFEELARLQGKKYAYEMCECFIQHEIDFPQVLSEEYKAKRRAEGKCLVVPFAKERFCS
jgi:hypothetical protein